MAIFRQPWRWLPFGIRLSLARLRSRAAQHRILRRSLVVAGLALGAVVLLGARAQSVAAHKMWGDTIDVLVVSEGVASGDPFVGNVKLATRPAAFVPDDALAEVFDTVEHAVRSLEPGDIVTARDLASSSHAVRLNPDERAVSLPLGPGVPSVKVGDQVELYVVFDSFGDSAEEPERIDSARVIDLGEDDVTVAVDAADVSMLARASTSGQIIVARR